MNRLIKILKEWTLPVSMSTGILVYFIFYFTPALDGASRVFNSFFDFILPWILFVILLASLGQLSLLKQIAFRYCIRLRRYLTAWQSRRK